MKSYTLSFPVACTGTLVTKAETIEEARAKFLAMLDEPYFLDIETEDAEPDFSVASIDSEDEASEDLY